MARKTRSSEPTDLLGYIKPRNTVGDPDQYLKASDFYVSPELSSSDIYPSKDQPLEVGQSPSKYFGGGIPIFVGDGALFPAAAVSKRQNAMDKAALQAKLYNQRVKESANKDLEGLYKMPGDVNYVYDEDLKKDTISGYRNIYDQALNAYGGNKLSAINDMRDSSGGKYGRQLQDFMTQQKIKENTINQMTDIAAKAETAVADHNASLPPAFKAGLDEFRSGKLYSGNTEDIKHKVAAMGIMHDVIPFYNELLNSVDPEETFGTGKEKGYTVTAVNKDTAKSRALMQLQAQPQVRTGYAMSVGLPSTASDEQIADKMADQIVQQKGRKIDRIPVTETSQAEKDKQWQTDGNSFFDGKNVFVYNADSKGNETITFRKKDAAAAENKTLTFTRGKETIEGIPLRFEYPADAKVPHIVIAQKEQVPNPQYLQGIGGPTITETKETVVPYIPANADVIKGEYGKTLFEVRHAITGSMEKGTGSTGSMSDGSVSNTSSSSGSSKVKVSKDGKEYFLPASQLQDAIKEGYAEVK